MFKHLLILASTFLFLSPSFAKDKKQADFEVLQKKVQANLAVWPPQPIFQIGFFNPSYL